MIENYKPPLPEKPSRRRKIVSTSRRMDIDNLISPTPKNPTLKKISPPHPTVDLLGRCGGTKKVINIPALVISDEIFEIVQRFNLCECAECLNLLFVEVLRQVPPRFVIGEGFSVTENEVAVAMEEIRPEIRKALTQISIAARGKKKKHK